MAGERSEPKVWTADGRVWFAQAIRGPACLLVIAAHFGQIFLTEQPTVGAIALFPPLSGLPRPPWAGVTEFLADANLSLGHIGVFLFFLVSGFVIPFSLRDGRLGGFFVRRFFRLYPTLWACLGVTVLTLVVHLHALGYSLPYDAKAVAGNGLLLSPYLRSRWIEPVLWTLAIEELFYLVAALVAWRGRLADGRVIAAVAAGLTVLALAAGPQQRPAQILFWLGFNCTFILFILVGLVFHQLFHGRWGAGRSAAGGTGLVACYALALWRGPVSPQADVYLVSSAVALAVFGGLYAGRRRLPYWRPLDALSNVSYPLYLVHAVSGYVVIRVVFVETGNYYLSAVTAVAGALAVASAVHLLVERPSITAGRRVTRRPRIGARSGPDVDGHGGRPQASEPGPTLTGPIHPAPVERASTGRSPHPIGAPPTPTPGHAGP